MADEPEQQHQQDRGLARGYNLECSACPLPDPAGWCSAVLPLLSSGEFGAAFGETWGLDLSRRAATSGTIVATVRWDPGGTPHPAVVAHAMVAFDPAAVPSVGLVLPAQACQFPRLAVDHVVCQMTAVTSPRRP